jgi:hypothetical protein
MYKENLRTTTILEIELITTVCHVSSAGKMGDTANIIKVSINITESSSRELKIFSIPPCNAENSDCKNRNRNSNERRCVGARKVTRVERITV